MNVTTTDVKPRKGLRLFHRHRHAAPILQPRTRQALLGLLSITLLFGGSYALGQDTTLATDRSYDLSIAGRVLSPQPGIEAQLAERLAARIASGEPVRALIQFERIPSRTEREALKARGLQLVSYAGGNAYHAVLNGSTPLSFEDPAAVAQYPAIRLVRWIGALTPADKIDPALRDKGPGDWATNPDGSIKVAVHFYPDVEREAARAAVARHDAEIESERARRVSFHVVIDPSRVGSLAVEESVMTISRYPPPKIESNDGSRAWTQTDNVHAQVLESDPAVHVEGGGVILGMWDGNEIDGDHDDLGARVVLGEATGTTSEHSTHVACTMAGSGAINFALRGHAPAAGQIVSYNFAGDVPTEMGNALTTHDVVATNNSWNYGVGWGLTDTSDPDWMQWEWGFTNNQDDFGAYLYDSADFDALVRDEGLPIVVAAGNDRDNPWPASTHPSATPTAAEPADWDQGTGNGGYDTIAPDGSAKNVITVGAIGDADSAMTSFSGWGPTDDGRIKPDLVAPGSWLQSCDDDPNDAYTWYQGTSMAAPAVTGATALLIQTYRDEFLGDPDADAVPWPSTVKALLINSTQELGTPGPDYQFGWGGLDAKAAYDLLRARRLVELDFYETGEEDAFVIDVGAGEPLLKVTLCWDDFPGDGLRNDLDLSLESPAGGGVQRPWILDPDPDHWSDAAATGLDRSNNCEQVQVGAPAEGTWKINVTAFTLAEPVADPYQRYSLVSNLPFHEADNVSVVQVIDRTGSMSHRDDPDAMSYMESAKAAATNFLGLMHLGDEAGALAFDDPGCDNTDPKAETLATLTGLVDDAARDAVISSIDPIGARGCTSIGAGLQLGEDGPGFLDGASPDQPHALVLLTDGFENTPPWVRERPAGFEYLPALPDNVLDDIDVTTDIYTISLGPHSDSDLMREIAEATGGRFYQSPTILGLLSVYYQIHGDLALQEITGIESGVKGLGNDARTTTVDPGSSEATFAVGWLQSEGQLRLALTDPGNQPVAADDPNVSALARDHQYLLRVRDPMAGDWTVRLIRDDTGDLPIDYTYAAFVDGVPKLWSFVPTTTMVGDCLIPRVRLFDRATGHPITGADVKAIITAPTASQFTLNYQYRSAQDAAFGSWLVGMRQARAAEVTVLTDPLAGWARNLQTYNAQTLADTGESIFRYETTQVTLLDDGSHEDEGPGDGIYAYCADATRIAGSYNVRFEISGVDTAGMGFERAALATSVLRPGPIDPTATPVLVEPSVIDTVEGSQGSIAVIPTDRYGNVWGPGHASRISIDASAGSLSGDLVDQGDGFYVQTLMTTGERETGRVMVNIDGVEMRARPNVRFGESNRLMWIIILLAILVLIVLIVQQLRRGSGP